LSKVPAHQVIQEQIDSDIWQDEYEYREDYWDSVHSGEMSWWWWYAVSTLRSKGWKYVVINPNHKNVTVINWIKENYPNCEYRNQDDHFLIEQAEVATMVALKWA
jgi:hypothetical protein